MKKHTRVSDLVPFFGCSTDFLLKHKRLMFFMLLLTAGLTTGALLIFGREKIHSMTSNSVLLEILFEAIFLSTALFWSAGTFLFIRSMNDWWGSLSDSQRNKILGWTVSIVGALSLHACIKDELPSVLFSWSWDVVFYTLCALLLAYLMIRRRIRREKDQ